MKPIPVDGRLGQTLADHRFLVESWLGDSPWMGVAIATDRRDGSRARVTISGPTDLSWETLRGRFARSVPGLAEVTYLGPVVSDDGWGQESIAIAESLGSTPTGVPSQVEPAVLAARIAALLSRCHAKFEPLGTLRPESLRLLDHEVLWLGRGERFWLLARPLSVGAVSPYAPGYCAPELVAGGPRIAPVDASADVFSFGVLVAERILGRFPYPRTSFTGLFEAQATNAFEQLPKSPLGVLVQQCMSADAAQRPSVAELVAATST